MLDQRGIDIINKSVRKQFAKRECPECGHLADNVYEEKAHSTIHETIGDYESII